MYNAFDPQLMPLDGKTGAESDGHDWQSIFGDLGLLNRAHSFGLAWGKAGQAWILASRLAAVGTEPEPLGQSVR